MQIFCNFSSFRSPIKVAIERQKQHYKAGWLNSPNSYVKKEVEETGTTNPKKITKVSTLVKYTGIVPGSIWMYNIIFNI